MSDNTERELRRVIDRARRADDYSLIGTDRIVHAILAEFIPDHDRKVAEKAFESFLSYRLLPDDVREYVTEYIKAGRES